ncbi:STAS domain-containing protein [Actinophytocola sp.]|uniref:STAS domain-containing protein n=1 Tax=Actinophytocola sp. TaxID=1872138 RepID=UPI00389A411A
MTRTVLRLENQALDEAVVVAPVGRLDVATYRQLRDHLIKVGTDNPRAIVVDLNGLEIESDSTLAIFPAVHTRLQVWPGVPLLLVSGTGRVRTRLARNRTARYLPVLETIAEAMAALDDPPPCRVAHVQLPNSLASPRLAREFVRLTCVDWNLELLLDDALLLVGELVTNAVMHTYSAPSVRLELRRNVFSVAVRDDTPGEINMRDPGGDAAGIHGLLLVAQIATVWGCSPTSSGGKVVWATLRTRR